MKQTPFNTHVHSQTVGAIAGHCRVCRQLVATDRRDSRFFASTTVTPANQISTKSVPVYFCAHPRSIPAKRAIKPVTPSMAQHNLTLSRRLKKRDPPTAFYSNVHHSKRSQQQFEWPRLSCTRRQRRVCYHTNLNKRRSLSQVLSVNKM